VSASAPSTSVAKAPGPEDLVAMAAEADPPEFRFAHPDALPDDLAGLGLVVLDRADQLSDDDAQALSAVTAAPVLAITRTGRTPALVRDPVELDGAPAPAPVRRTRGR
jgi:hypothetical protein